MPRASGNDLCEIFGYAPDDTSEAARKQCKSQQCPFVGGICIKHSHPQQDGAVVVYGSCSVRNLLRDKTVEEVIICPQRLYADEYRILRECVTDAIGVTLPILTPEQYSARKRSKTIPSDCVVMLGQNWGKEVVISLPEVVKVSLDWVFVRVVDQKPQMFIPAEVQSIDTTGNYHANWRAYASERAKIPDSEHGMNWANVWKRLIPQLIIKGAVASTSKLASKGIYFVAPEVVFRRFERLVGKPPEQSRAGAGVMSIVTYALGSTVKFGQIRTLTKVRTVRTSSTDFASAFASGKQLLALGNVLDQKIIETLEQL